MSKSYWGFHIPWINSIRISGLNSVRTNTETLNAKEDLDQEKMGEDHEYAEIGGKSGSEYEEKTLDAATLSRPLPKLPDYQLTPYEV